MRILKQYVLILAAISLAGCSTLQDAYYSDRDFGLDSQASFDSQILNQDYRYAEEVAEGMPGITAEEVMKVHNQTFSEKPQKSQVFEFSMK